ncbi:hypothetical protein KAI68_04695 [bacterium]|nr:hypothetical protein [bacterium]
MKKIFISLSLIINIFYFSPNRVEGRFLFKRDCLPVVVLSLSQPEYLHYDIVKITVGINDKKVQNFLKENNFYALVYKDNIVQSTIGKKKAISFKYNKDKELWEGSWPVFWNADEGEYLVKLFFPQQIQKINEGKNTKLETKFSIKRKVPFDLKPGLCVITFENPVPLKRKVFKGPDGEKGDWKKIFDWVEFAGGNTFWYLAGQTANYRHGNLTDDFPWIKDNLEFMPEFAAYAHQRGIKFGAWVVAYLTFGRAHKELNYDYAWEYNAKKNICFPTRSVSIGDKKRLKDIIEFIKYLNNMPEIDYIGIDYIRNALGGYELVDDFVAEMEVKTPPQWKEFSRQERMIWLARKKIARKDWALIDQWQWWRARQTALIIKKIRKEVKLKKPLWAYTLSWDKGWQHGQDPVMFNAAGVDIDAVMLYEADKEQYDTLINDWHKYMGKNQANIVGGNIVDWPLHQRTVNPAGPEEMYNRSMRAVNEIYKDGISKGVFIHCLSRILWGRRGPYSRHEWMLAGGALFSRLREKWKIYFLKTDVLAPSKAVFNKVFRIKVKVNNLKPEEICDIKVRILPQKGIKVIGKNCKKIKIIGPAYEVVVPFKIKINKFYPKRDGRYMVVAQTEWIEKEEKQKNIAFQYVQAIEIPEKLVEQAEELDKQKDNNNKGNSVENNKNNNEKVKKDDNKEEKTDFVPLKKSFPKENKRNE